MENLPKYYKLDRFKGFDSERELELAGIEAQTSNETFFWAGTLNFFSLFLPTDNIDYSSLIEQSLIYQFCWPLLLSYHNINYYYFSGRCLL